jgi:hypothetical protein
VIRDMLAYTALHWCGGGIKGCSSKLGHGDLKWAVVSCQQHTTARKLPRPCVLACVKSSTDSRCKGPTDIAIVLVHWVTWCGILEVSVATHAS